MNRIKERIKRLEEQVPVITNETKLNKALKVVFEEATTHELMIATGSGSGKYGEMATPEQQNEMCDVFIRRAKTMVRSEQKSR